MTNFEKALLIEALSKALEANKSVGTYDKLELLLATKISEITKSINVETKVKNN